MKKPDKEAVQALELKLRNALEDLIKLTEDRKKQGCNFWADPDAVREASTPEKMEELKKLSPEAGETVNAIFEVFDSTEIANYFLILINLFGQWDKQALTLQESGEVADSVRSFCELCFRLEIVLLSALDIYEGLNEATDYKNEVARNALKESAEFYKQLITDLRNRHDGLYDFQYL